MSVMITQGLGSENQLILEGLGIPLEPIEEELDMNDLQYISGIVISAETLTGITGATSFRGEDSQGPYTYNARLNSFTGIRSRLLLAEQPQYDYIVNGTGGLNVRDDWVSDIQTEVFWELVPVRTEVEVSNDNVNWTKMHFAEYDPTSPDGKFYYVYVEGRTDWSTIGGSEVFEITMVAASGLNSKYLLMFSHTATYYVWFNVDSLGIDPGGVGGPLVGLGYTEVEVALDGTDTAELVATKTKVVINGLAEFMSIISPNDSTIVAVASAVAGNVYDAQPGNSGLTIEIKIQGGDKESYQYARLL